jgi:hypothetical protein
MLEGTDSGLHQDNQLTREDLRMATIEGTIPTMIANSRASTTCIQSGEE